jgi:hypothetical protein
LTTIAFGNKPLSACAELAGKIVASRLMTITPTALIILDFGGTRMLKDSPRSLDIHSTENDRQERAML